MSSNTAPPVIFCATIAELQAVHIAELLLGARCYVLSVDDNFYLVENPSLVPDGVNVVQSVPGAIVGKPGAVWATLAAGGGSGSITPPQTAAVLQPVWYINALTGSDTNDGATPATALKTLTEWSYRIGPQAIGITMVVHVLTDLLPTDTPMGPINVLGGATLTIQGQVNVVASSVFSAVTVVNPATNTPWSATAAAVNWAAQIAAGTRVRMTGGPSTGAIFWPAKDLGAGTCRFSYPMTADPALGVFGQAQQTITTNSFDVESTVSLGNFALAVNVERAGAFQMVDCTITGSDFSCQNDFSQSALYACQLGGAVSDFGASYINCGSTAMLNHTQLVSVTFFGGLALGGQSFAGGFVAIDLGAMAQDGNLQFFAGGGFMILSNAQIFDWGVGNAGQAAVQVWQGEIVQVFEFMIPGKLVYGLDGSGAGNFGFRVQAGSSVLYEADTTGLTVVGPVGQVGVGTNATLKNYADLPYIEGEWLQTTVTTAAIPALTANTPAAQSFPIANLDATRTQIIVNPQTDLGAGVEWNAFIDAPGSLQVRIFTATTGGPIAVPQTVFNVTYIIDPGPFSSGMFLE